MGPASDSQVETTCWEAMFAATQPARFANAAAVSAPNQAPSGTNAPPSGAAKNAPAAAPAALAPLD